MRIKEKKVGESRIVFFLSCMRIWEDKRMWVDIYFLALYESREEKKKKYTFTK